MPSTRSCRNLSITNGQKKIDFPCRKTRSSKSGKDLMSNGDDSNNLKDLQEEKKENSNKSRKRISVRIDENASPCKSPKKEVKSPYKSPLYDRSNLNVESPFSELIVKRKLNLEVNNENNDLRRALHTSIPKTLISREREQSFIQSFMKKALVDMKPASLYMSGAPGTGKTACLMKALEEIKCSGCKKFRSVFINCMSIKCSQNIFTKLACEFSDGQAYALKDSRRFLGKKFTSTGPKILLVLDEIDQLESKNQEVLYKLFEIPFLPKSRLILIGIANALDLTDRILPRLQSKASCKPLLLQFSPYNKDEICSILNARINEVDPNAIDPAAIQFCARKVCAITGDVRKALDILRRAVEVKESKEKKNRGDSTGHAKTSKVTIAHVASVCSEVYGTRLASTSTPVSFPLQQKLVICSLMVSLKEKAKEVTTGKLYDVYSRVCRSRHVKGVAQEEFSGLCSLLESQGIFGIKRTKDSRNNKITLRLEKSEVEHALQDKSLISSILTSSILSNPSS